MMLASSLLPGAQAATPLRHDGSRTPPVVSVSETDPRATEKVFSVRGSSSKISFVDMFGDKDDAAHDVRPVHCHWVPCHRPELPFWDCDWIDQATPLHSFFGQNVRIEGGVCHEADSVHVQA